MRPDHRAPSAPVPAHGRERHHDDPAPCDGRCLSKPRPTDPSVTPVSSRDLGGRQGSAVQRDQKQRAESRTVRRGFTPAQQLMARLPDIELSAWRRPVTIERSASRSVPWAAMAGACSGSACSDTCLLEIMHGMLPHPWVFFRSGMFNRLEKLPRAFLPKAWRKSKRLRGSARGPEVSNASLAVTNLAPGNTGISLLLAFENAAREQGAALLRDKARPDNIRAREVFEGLVWEAYAQTPTKVSYAKYLT